MTDRLKEILNTLEENRQRALSGKYNCVPFPFKTLSKDIPGIEHEKFWIITAMQKVGKSKFADKTFVYYPIHFMLQHPEVKIKILYFTFEMSKENKYLEYLSHLLYMLSDIIVSPVDLKSINKEKPVNEEVLNLLKSEEYRPYIEKYEQCVQYIDDQKNPTGIRKNILSYADAHGHFEYEKVPITNEITGEKEYVDKIVKYIPDDPEEYVFVILDNAANISTERGYPTLRDAVNKVSKDFVAIRNRYKYDLVLIQHQSQSKEDNDSFKLNRLEPSSDGLGDMKTSARDINVMLGLFDPYKYGKDGYAKYTNLGHGGFEGCARFLKVIEDRDYGANNNIYALFFNGASSDFEELPSPNEPHKLLKFYELAKRIKNINPPSKPNILRKTPAMFVHIKNKIIGSLT